MIERLPASSDRLLAFRLSGTVTHSDYEKVLLPAFAQASEVPGKLAVLFELADDFHGWDTRAVWDDAVHGAQYWGCLGHFAMIGETRWEELLSDLVGLWPGVESRFFRPSEANEAWEWLRSAPDYDMVV